jgi:hypothetical protein
VRGPLERRRIRVVDARPTALDVLHATGGAAIGITDARLGAAGRTVRRAGLSATPAGSAGLAAMLLAVSDTGRTQGGHVAVLTG